MADTDKIRAFVAVTIPPDIRNKIAQIGDEIYKKPKELKIVKSDNYHLTLAFIGEISQEKLTPLEKPFSLFCESFKQFEVLFGRVGTFPGVIFLEAIKGEEKLIDLASAIRTILRNNSIPYDSKPFKGHLTLARTRNRGAKAASFLVEDIFKRSYEIGFQVTGFSIYKSVLTPSGPIYTSLSSFNLAPVSNQKD